MDKTDTVFHFLKYRSTVHLSSNLLWALVCWSLKWSHWGWLLCIDVWTLNIPLKVSLHTIHTQIERTLMPTYSSCSVCHEIFLSSTSCLSGIHLKKKIIQTAFSIKELWRPFSEKISTSPKVYTKVLTDKGAENHLRSSVEQTVCRKLLPVFCFAAGSSSARLLCMSSACWRPWQSSQVIKAPRLAAFSVFFISKLITCTGCQGFCSLSHRSFTTILYTLSAQVKMTSKGSVHSWNSSGQGLIISFLPSMWNTPLLL